MENFFAGSKYALYVVGLFFFIVQSTVKREEYTNKNIILIYIIYALTNIFDIIGIGLNTFIILGICFVEMQVMTLSDKEGILLTRTGYKFIDYGFTMFNKYKVIPIILLNILFSFSANMNEYGLILAFILNGIGKITFFNILPIISTITTIFRFIAVIIIAIKFFEYISKIYSNTFRVKRLEKVEKEFEELSKGFFRTYNLEQKIQMLTEIEDKTFFFRKNAYTTINFTTLVYKINKSNTQVQNINEMKNMTMEGRIQYIISNFSKVFHLGMKIIKAVIKAVFLENGVKRFIKRGYSTIEMQLMRQMAVEIGYEKTYTRKIYEFLYTHMFFSSLYEKRKNNNYEKHEKTFKKRIAYVYFRKVPTYLNTDKIYKRCNNIKEFYKTVRTQDEILESELEDNEIVYVLTLEEMFIFILGLSGKALNDYTFYLYEDCINKYNLDIDKIRQIVSKIDNFYLLEKK